MRNLLSGIAFGGNGGYMPYTNTHDFRSSTAYQAGEDNELTTSPRIDLTRTRIRIILELPDESFASLGFQQNDSGERNESASNDDRELSLSLIHI